jgi:tRNA (guanine10-N2)-methyltransferase
MFRGTRSDFRLDELRAVTSRFRGCCERDCADLCVIPALTELEPERHHRTDIAGVVLYGQVFCYANFRSVEEACAVARQCILVRAIFVPLGHGRDYIQCVQSLSEMRAGEACLDMMADGDLKKSLSFKCAVEAFGRKYTMPEQLERMERFHALFERFSGPVRLRNPDSEFWIIEDAFPATGHKSDSAHGNPRQIFLGRKVTDGAAHLGHEFHLSRRCYIGPTSMDAELAFVMANMAHVRPGSLILDPFCGTGSVLVSCARLGAHVIGSDLSINVLRGKPDGTNIVSNFDQYGLTRPVGILRSDLLHSPFQTKRPWLDAIVCDPPYGIKEGTRSFRDSAGSATKHRTESHIPGTERVRLTDFLDGLLQFASSNLVPGGRLVYWLPTTRDYCDEDLPLHRLLRIVSNCEQVMTMRMSRRLITMQRLTNDEAKHYLESECEPGSQLRRSLTHVPAHFDFAAKVLRQPVRRDSKLPARQKHAL